MRSRSSQPGDEAARPMVVLQSLRTVRPTTNPYLVMLVRGLDASPDVSIRWFSYRAALLGRYDLFHVHWPEILLDGRTPLRRMVRQLLLVALLIRLTVCRAPVVRTMHNVERPAGLRWHEHKLLDWMDARTRLVIRLNAHTPPMPKALDVVIPHGHYRDWLAWHPHAEAVRGRFGYVGLVRRYKGVETLVAAFAGLPDTPDRAYSLVVGGKPSTEQLAGQLIELSVPDQRITMELHFLADPELVRIVTSASLIVLPYRFMHNSGTVLAALSLDRPVLVPDTVVNRELAAEVGPGWVQTYRGELDAEDLATAMASAETVIGRRPDLSRREWDRGVHDHAAAYRQILERPKISAKRVTVGASTTGDAQ